jgi:hypothetical protein
MPGIVSTQLGRLNDPTIGLRRFRLVFGRAA